jgi:tRNA U34 5-methylaminomethyl-2-thiouridine-forming methyltransferase MnmC
VDVPKLIITEDGSHTLYVPELNEHYHSVHGAVNESMHVYIQAGLKHIHQSHIRILEVGFGTGLNALLTMQHAQHKTIDYVAFEKYPLPEEVWQQINYDQLNGIDNCFELLHRAKWNESVALSAAFALCKIAGDFRDADIVAPIDLIYFDAFGPDKQGDLWTEEVFRKIYAATAPQGVLVTYCAKGRVRRMLQEVGFSVERLPGPPPKKEMLRAIKTV